MPFEEKVELRCTSTGETRFYPRLKARKILEYTDEWVKVESAAPKLPLKKKTKKKDAASKPETE